MQEYLFEYFNEEGHHEFLEDASIKEPLKGENYRESFLKTMTPLGLNIEDSVWETF